LTPVHYSCPILVVILAFINIFFVLQPRSVVVLANNARDTATTYCLLLSFHLIVSIHSQPLLLLGRCPSLGILPVNDKPIYLSVHSLLHVLFHNFNFHTSRPLSLLHKHHSKNTYKLIQHGCGFTQPPRLLGAVQAMPTVVPSWNL